MTIIAQNLKRLRTARSMTQEQAAAALGVSAQTVSRWECCSTMPDIAMLPTIARLYGVTIDDLYRETSVAYENYAQRLAGIFEASLKPEDFLPAELEFRKLLRSDRATARDLRLYGILHQNMEYVCRNQALELYDRVIRQGPGDDPDSYWATRRQKGYFLWELGRNRENIEEFLPLVEAGSTELQEWLCLIQAYTLAEDYGTAWHWTERANALFPESAALHIYTGDLLRSMNRSAEAFPHWQRALELDPDGVDAAWSMAECCSQLGDHTRAAEIYGEIADNLARRGFTEEVHLPRTLAAKEKEASIKPGKP